MSRLVADGIWRIGPVTSLPAVIEISSGFTMFYYPVSAEYFTPLESNSLCSLPQRSLAWNLPWFEPKIGLLSSLFHFTVGTGDPRELHARVTFPPSFSSTSFDVISSLMYGGTAKLYYRVIHHNSDALRNEG